MRLEAISTPVVNSAISAVKPGAASEKAPELAEGDVIQARVLSVGDGTASLRTSDGTLLQARLENGVSLSPGADVYLLVRDSGTDIAVMTPVNPESGAMTSDTNNITADPLLNTIIDQLISLGYKPSAENISAMKQLLAEAPNVSIQEAAFFAAQKLEPEPALQAAFRALTSGEATTASLLEALAAVSKTLTLPAAPEAVQSPVVNTPAEVAQLPVVITAPLTAPEGSAALPENPIALPLEITALSATENASTETSAFTTAQPPVPEPALPEFGRWLLEALGTEAVTVEAAEAPALTREALAGSPLLDGLSERSLAGMSESLNRIAVSMPKASSEAELFENITRFTRELFVRLDDNDGTKLQDRLKEVREELYIKLAYFKDAVASSGSVAKGVVLEQTQKLMDHLRLLNGLDQFVCVQIPVRLEQQTGNADLYIYKRKKNGTPRIDPENVKILLALDLTHMGRLETLIEISGRDVSLRFDVESDDVASTLRQNSTRLHQLLDSAGYRFVGSTFAAKKSDTTIETALLSLLEAENGRGAVDIIL